MKHCINRKTLAAVVLLLFAAKSNGQSDHNQQDLFIVKSQPGLQFPVSSTGFTGSYITGFSKKTGLHSYFGLFDVPMKYYPDDVQRSIKEKFPGCNLNEKPSGIILDFVNTQYSYIQNFLVKNYSNVKNMGSYSLNADTTKFYLTDVGKWYAPLFFNLSMTNLSKSLNQFFTSTNQPTVQIEIGAIQNAVTNFNNWQKLKQDGRSQFRAYDYDFFYSIYVNTSLINYYDTLHHQVTTTSWSTFTRFAQYGVKFNLNLYYFKWLAVALTSNTYKGLSLQNDSSYQNQIPGIISDTPLVVKSNIASGKYGGNINYRPVSERFSIAMPVFLYFLDFLAHGKHDPNRNTSDTSQIYILPSFASYGPIGGHWTNQLGISINFLSHGYGGLSSSIVQLGGLGCDFITAKTHTGWGNALFYISGNINLSNLIKVGSPDSKPRAFL
jgi:hypothetical protein